MGEKRASGRTTRLIDKYIQELFTKKEVVIKDHYRNAQADYFLSERVLRRLALEHSGIKVERINKDSDIILKLKDN